MKCYQCKEEIVLPSSNVRFKELGKEEYVFLHNAEEKQCWRQFMLARKPGLLPGSGAYQPPHSSTTSATFFPGSYLSMIAECFSTRSFISSVDLRICAYSVSPNPTDA